MTASASLLICFLLGPHSTVKLPIAITEARGSFILTYSAFYRGGCLLSGQHLVCDDTAKMGPGQDSDLSSLVPGM